MHMFHELNIFDIDTQQWTVVEPTADDALMQRLAEEVEPTSPMPAMTEAASAFATAEVSPFTATSGAALSSDVAGQHAEPTTSFPEHGGAPLARLNQAAVVDGDRLLLFGDSASFGDHTASNGGDVYSLDLTTFQWSLLETTEPRPSRRQSHAMAIDADARRVFLHNGLCRSRLQCLTDMWALDLSTSPATWTRLDSAQEEGPPEGSPSSAPDPSLFQRPPVGLCGHSMVLRGESLYIFGGMTSCGTGRQLQYSNILYCYNTAAGQWSRPHVRGCGVGSGITPAPAPVAGFFGRLQPDHHARHLPPPRYSHVSWLDDEGLYIHGGDANRCTVYYDDLWKYHFSTGEWEDLTHKAGGPRPSARSGHSAVAVDGMVYMFGGELANQGIRGRHIYYSKALFRLCCSFDVNARLTDLCGRWLVALSDFEPYEDPTEDPRVTPQRRSPFAAPQRAVDSELKGLDEGQLHMVEALPPSARWAVVKLWRHKLHRHMPRTAKSTASEKTYGLSNPNTL